MPQIPIDKISVDELYALKREIDAFINTQDAAERAYCEGCAEYGELLQTSLNKAQVMKQQVRSLVSALGIHGEFLDEYVVSCQRHGLQIVVAA